MESQAVSIAKPSVCSFITITRNKLGGGGGVEVDRGRGSANSLESDNGVSFEISILGSYNIFISSKF